MASQPSSASKWSLTERRDHSLVSLTGTLATPLKRFDLMHQVNARGTFACSQACIPHLLKAENPHILNIV
jgi:citronellol/citronellal dehydrogenase